METINCFMGAQKYMNTACDKVTDDDHRKKCSEGLKEAIEDLIEAVRKECKEDEPQYRLKCKRQFNYIQALVG